MGKWFIFSSGMLFAFVLCGQGIAQDDRPDLTGTWQLNSSKSELGLSKFSELKMVIAEKDGKINISEDEVVGGKPRNVVYDCTTDGKDCAVKATGAKASFWYNGPMLVSMETEKKGDVFRYRMKLSPDAKQLVVEVSCLVPTTDKIDKLVLEKR